LILDIIKEINDYSHCCTTNDNVSIQDIVISSIVNHVQSITESDILFKKLFSSFQLLKMMLKPIKPTIEQNNSVKNESIRDSYI
jgi:hypothetical protein